MRYSYSEARDLVERWKRRGSRGQGVRIGRNTWLVTSYHSSGSYGHTLSQVTCGTCTRSWCSICDPAPAALCHWCHGCRDASDPGPLIYAVKLHQTEIIRIYPDGTYTLHAGGWRTVTTLARLRDFAPCNVHSDFGEWWLVGYGTKLAKFDDGVRVSEIGRVVDGSDASVSDDIEQARQALRDRRNARRRAARGGGEARPRGNGKRTPSGAAFMRLRKAKSGSELPDAWLALTNWTHSVSEPARRFFQAQPWLHEINSAVMDAVTVPAKRTAIRMALELFAPWRALEGDAFERAIATALRVHSSAVR